MFCPRKHVFQMFPGYDTWFSVQQILLLLDQPLSLSLADQHNTIPSCFLLFLEKSQQGTMLIIEGSLEAKLPTIWTDGKALQLGGSSDVEKIRKGEDAGREKMQVREKVGKSPNTVFFQCFVAPEGRKVGSLKRRVRR